MEENERGKFPGGTWLIIRHAVSRNYVDGEIREKIIWRGVIRVTSTAKKYWKGSYDRSVIERWVKDKIYELREYPAPKNVERHDNIKKRKPRTKKNGKAE